MKRLVSYNGLSDNKYFVFTAENVKKYNNFAAIKTRRGKLVKIYTLYQIVDNCLNLPYF